ncbi:MAG: DUF2948 family protein [Janthinobacterium lividum]
MVENPADERLLLLAHEPDEVPLISALMQDATVRLVDVGYDSRARRLVLLTNRFRWEADGATRVRCALRIESVAAVQRRDWPKDPEAVLDLLALTVEGDAMMLTFAAGPVLRVRCECIDLVLEDISGPWGVDTGPEHD